MKESSKRKLIACVVLCALAVEIGIIATSMKGNTTYNVNRVEPKVNATSEVTEDKEYFDVKDYVDMTTICRRGKQCIVRDNLTNQLYYKRATYKSRSAMTPIYNADGTVKELSEVKADDIDIEEYFNYYLVGRSGNKYIVCDKNTKVLYYAELGTNSYVLTVITDKDDTGDFKVKLYEGEFDEET